MQDQLLENKLTSRVILESSKISCLHSRNMFSVQVPEGVDWAALIKNAMDKYSVEISGGLGGTAGKVWRVGLMGYNAQPAKVELVLACFRDGLKQQGKLK